MISTRNDLPLPSNPVLKKGRSLEASVASSKGERKRGRKEADRGKEKECEEAQRIESFTEESIDALIEEAKRGAEMEEGMGVSKMERSS